MAILRILTKFWGYLRRSFWIESPLLWAQIFAFGSLFFLALTLIEGNFQNIYRKLLLGFVFLYIIAVQHATIPFPKNKGGIFRVSAYLSFLLIFFGYFLHIWIFKLGFLLFLAFQLVPLVYYRIKISKKNYDKISYVFMTLAIIAGTTSLFLQGKPFLHSIFLGFELAMFLGCMAWMLPRFSKNLEDVKGQAYLSPILFSVALTLNLGGFILGYYPILRLASAFAILSILTFWKNFKNKFFTPFLHLPFIYFSLGFTFALLMKTKLHPYFVSSAMVGFAIIMGSRWYPLIFVQKHREFDLFLILSIISVSAAPILKIFYNIFSVAFLIWILNRIIPSLWKFLSRQVGY